MIRSFASVSLIVLVGACASTAPVDLPAPDPAPVVSDPVVPESEAGLAIMTAEQLVTAGNEQVAIDRLTQAIGDASLTAADQSELYFRRGEIRLGEGNDVFGAIDDFVKVTDLTPEAELAIRAEEYLAIARSEATRLNATLEQGGVSRSDRLETLWRLGRHDDAVDLLMDGGVTASPATLLDMYQIGYLCAGAQYTGPSYQITEPDGTPQTVRFCDFGK